MDRKEAIEVIKKNWPDNSFTRLCEALETLIPELAGSKDEKIKKQIIYAIKELPVCDETKRECIDWLEKQGEKDKEILVLKDQVESLHAAIKALKEAHKVELEKQGKQSFSNTRQECLKGIKRVRECQDLSDWEKKFDNIASLYAFNKNQEGYNEPWYVKERAAEMLYHAKKELEKQVEQKPIEDINGEDYGIDGLWHAQHILERTLGEVEGYQSDDGILEHKCAITAVRDLAKKQGEQKPAGKVEPKFKVKYAGSEYNVLEVKNIGGVTYFGIEDEPNHIDYILPDNCEYIDYILPDNCEIVSEQKPVDKVEPKFYEGD